MVSVCGGRALLIYDGKLMEKGRIGLGGEGGGVRVDQWWNLWRSDNVS